MEKRHAVREETLDRILEQIYRVRNLDLSGYRHSMLRRRVEAHLAVVGEAEADRYADRLGTDADEIDRLIDAVAVNVSEFFRDPLVFGLIDDAVLPRLFARACVAPAEGIRVWCAGCAAGEGAYSPDRVRFAAPEILDRYFTRVGDRYVVHSEIREMVRFSRDDLASPSTGTPKDSVYGAFHLVLCRNVLIYHGRALQSRVLEKLSAAVATRGFLVLGPSERLRGATEGRFREIAAGSRVYARKEPA
jgi:chemotaxis protein methyltransferase CheR